ncbi:uncharacterized protein LOC119550645 [Drosophila subpulchrella]|uniref:uncharacterized protein LOC119550645 n=1 Tax=Drosophila subpulchrella TaxID=1486046 RepID=UPI0018A17712|nr:uncharacterized protein LOC119550645 [Drosophila subpulchrella]
MSCICQFYTPGEEVPGDLATDPLPTTDDIPSVPSPAKKVDKDLLETKASETGVSASDLADCRAENWLLKKKLLEYEVTIENLEQLVTTIVEKQHQILSEMFYLRKENRELQSECHLQREYHSMERNALMRELHDARSSSRSRSFLLGCGSNGSKGSSNTDCEEEDISELDDHCENGCDSNEDQGLDADENCESPSAPSSGENSCRTSPSSSDSESSDTDDNTSRDYKSNEDTPISNGDTD